MAGSSTPKQGYTLRTYLRVQEEYDKQMYFLLRQVASELDALIKKHVGTGLAGEVRADQLRVLKREAQLMMADMLEKAGLTIEAGKLRSAAAAANVAFAYDRVLFEAAGVSTAALDMYRRSEVATARLGLEAARERLLGASYIPLSEQVWKTSQVASGALDRIIDGALAKGLSAKEMAAQLVNFANPNTPGGLSYVTMRLARTEINNAFHATQVNKNRERPWVTGTEWNLSGSHPTEDECNEYAEGQHAEGYAPGVFPNDRVPRKPHPNCLCYTTAETVDTDSFIDSLLDGGYDRYLDTVMRNSGFDARFIVNSRLK